MLSQEVLLERERSWEAIKEDLGAKEYEYCFSLCKQARESYTGSYEDELNLWVELLNRGQKLDRTVIGLSPEELRLKIIELDQSVGQYSSKEQQAFIQRIKESIYGVDRGEVKALLYRLEQGLDLVGTEGLSIDQLKVIKEKSQDLQKEIQLLEVCYPTKAIEIIYDIYKSTGIDIQQLPSLKKWLIYGGRENKLFQYEDTTLENQVREYWKLVNLDPYMEKISFMLIERGGCWDSFAELTKIKETLQKVDAGKVFYALKKSLYYRLDLKEELDILLAIAQNDPEYLKEGNINDNNREVIIDAVKMGISIPMEFLLNLGYDENVEVLKQYLLQRYPDLQEPDLQEPDLQEPDLYAHPFFYESNTTQLELLISKYGWNLYRRDIAGALDALRLTDLGQDVQSAIDRLKAENEEMPKELLWIIELGVILIHKNNYNIFSNGDVWQAFKKSDESIARKIRNLIEKYDSKIEEGQLKLDLILGCESYIKDNMQFESNEYIRKALMNILEYI